MMEMARSNGLYKMIEGPPHNRKHSCILLCECHNMKLLMFDTKNKEAVMSSLGVCLNCDRPTVSGYVPELELLVAKNAVGGNGAGRNEAGTKNARIAGEVVRESEKGTDGTDWQMGLFRRVSPKRRYRASFESRNSPNKESEQAVRSVDDGDWEMELFGSVSPSRKKYRYG
jgi:hypothetical protein